MLDSLLRWHLVPKAHEHFGPPYAVLNLSRIGLRYFRIGIKASNQSKERLVTYFMNHPNAGWIFYAKGYFDLAIGFWAKDNAEINDVSQQVRNTLSPNDEIVFQSELTSLYGFGNRPVSGVGDPMCIVDATANQLSLSPLEIDYIKLLALDSSLKASEFANILNISETDLQTLNQKLTDHGVIVGYQERVDYGGTYYKVFIDSLSRKSSGAEDTLLKRLWKDTACIYIERANSKYDLEFELVLENKNDLKQYLKGFSDVQVAILTKNIYTNLYPLNKVANLIAIKDTLLSQKGEFIDFRHSKLWYLNYTSAEAYLEIYSGNKKYFETMEKSELNLFDDVATFIHGKHSDKQFSIIDIGSGDGLKGKFFIDALGGRSVKAYYPVDIQPIELAVALNAHGKRSYAKHPTLLDIENLSTRFPLKLHQNEHQVYVFFGGTYGNFKQEQINAYLKPLVNPASSLVVSMPVRAGRTDEDIVSSYVGSTFDNMIFGPLSQAGFQRSDFESNPNYKEYIAHFAMEEGRLVSSLVLKRDIKVFDTVFKKGTIIKLTTSWKPTYDEFVKALENDFVLEKVFLNEDMAIAYIERLR